MSKFNKKPLNIFKVIDESWDKIWNSKKVKEARSLRIGIDRDDFDAKLVTKPIGRNFNDNEKNKIVYEVTFKKGVIYINDKKLGKPNLDSENDLVFQYVFDNPNKICRKEEIEKYCKRKIQKTFNAVISDLKFRGELKEMFFPRTSQNAIKFINPITEKYMRDNQIKSLEFIKSLKKN